MKPYIFPIIALGIVLIIVVPLVIMISKKDVSGTYQVKDEESAEISAIKQQAVAEYKANKFDKAIQYYKKALKMRPDNAELHNDLGSVYHDLGVKAAGPTWPNWESDLTDMAMQDAINEADFAISDTDSGYIVFKVSDKKVIDKIVKLARNAKCWVYVEGDEVNILKGKTMEALLKARDHFLRATIIKPNYANAYRNLGALYYRIGMREEGLKRMKYALKLNPSDKQLKTYLEQFE